MSVAVVYQCDAAKCQYIVVYAGIHTYINVHLSVLGSFVSIALYKNANISL